MAWSTTKAIFAFTLAVATAFPASEAQAKRPPPLIQRYECNLDVASVSAIVRYVDEIAGPAAEVHDNPIYPDSWFAIFEVNDDGVVVSFDAYYAWGIDLDTSRFREILPLMRIASGAADCNFRELQFIVACEEMRAGHCTSDPHGNAYLKT